MQSFQASTGGFFLPSQCAGLHLSETDIKFIEERLFVVFIYGLSNCLLKLYSLSLPLDSMGINRAGVRAPAVETEL